MRQSPKYRYDCIWPVWLHPPSHMAMFFHLVTLFHMTMLVQMTIYEGMMAFFHFTMIPLKRRSIKQRSCVSKTCFQGVYPRRVSKGCSHSQIYIFSKVKGTNHNGYYIKRSRSRGAVELTFTTRLTDAQCFTPHRPTSACTSQLLHDCT